MPAAAASLRAAPERLLRRDGRCHAARRHCQRYHSAPCYALSLLFTLRHAAIPRSSFQLCLRVRVLLEHAIFYFDVVLPREYAARQYGCAARGAAALILPCATAARAARRQRHAAARCSANDAAAVMIVRLMPPCLLFARSPASF